MNKLITWVNKHTIAVAFGTILIGLIWIIFGPLLLTKFSIVSFPGDFDTGKIGDTIGGITAPVIGLISAVLLFITILKQVESINLSKIEANYRIINITIEDISNCLSKYEYLNNVGSKAIEMIATNFHNKNDAPFDSINHNNLNKLLEFEIILRKYKKIEILIRNIDSQSDLRHVIKWDLDNIYSLYLKDGASFIFDNWTLADDDCVPEISSKMKLLKIRLEEIKKLSE